MPVDMRGRLPVADTEVTGCCKLTSGLLRVAPVRLVLLPCELHDDTIDLTTSFTPE